MYKRQLLDSRAFDQITVMVQKEVAERICAAPGTSAYSAFSIYVQYRAAAEILFDVPADCFVPRPKVDSAVLRLTPCLLYTSGSGRKCRTAFLRRISANWPARS